MNLNAYDDVEVKLDKTKTWVCPINKILYSREITKRKYNLLSKRFNTTTNDTEYFIIMLDDAPVDRTYAKSFIDSFGRLKINLASIWNKTSLSNIKHTSNIIINHIEHTDDGDIYQLDV